MKKSHPAWCFWQRCGAARSNQQKPAFSIPASSSQSSAETWSPVKKTCSMKGGETWLLPVMMFGW